MRSDDETAARNAFFDRAVQKFGAEVNARAAPDGVELRLETIPFVTSLYFSISDAYKKKRVFKPDEHKTEPYKVAAITTATLSGICLLEPIDNDNVTSDWVSLSNELFSVYCACAILDIDHWKIPEAILRRHYVALRTLELDACTGFAALARSRPDEALAIPSIELSRNDLFALDQLVNIYMGWWASY